MVCDKVGAVLEEAGHEVASMDVKLTEPSAVGEADVYVLACPTYGQGELEMYFAKFLAKAGDWDLSGRKCAVIGLGDVKYHKDYLFESANILEEFLKEQSAEIIYRPLKVAMTPIPRLENVINNWAVEFAKLI